MRFAILIRLAMAAAVSASVFPGCSSNQRTSSFALPPSGVPALAAAPAGAQKHRVVYVSSDAEPNEIVRLQYGSWSQLPPYIGEFNQPSGMWVGRNHHLYVANRGEAAITEYDRSGHLLGVIAAGMTSPISVATDSLGHIFEGDNAGYVNEYPEGSDTVIAHCAIANSNVYGVAVDKHHDVFVDYTAKGQSGPAYLAEFRRGLSGSHCIQSLFPLQLQGYGGIAFDRQGNLVVCDSTAPAVDVVSPPFISVSTTIGTGWVYPLMPTLDRQGTQLYVSDPGSGEIHVLSYPAGTNVVTLGSADGVVQPYAAVDSQNFVP